MDIQISTLIEEEFLVPPQFGAHPILAKITSLQSQGYVANMDA
jgi:hypothetical protein